MSSQPNLAIIVRSDRPESVYPALILASTAASMGVKVEIFFTFYGLKALIKGGVEDIEAKFKESLGGEPRGVPPLKDLLNMAKSFGVELYACSTTLEAMGLKENILLEGIPVVGAATFVNRHIQGNSRILIF
ncbi:MAG: DsrE/DsrF/DrsH-like family protein [Acidilobaceae archaeon]